MTLMIWKEEPVCEMEVGLPPMIDALADFLGGRDDHKI